MHSVNVELYNVDNWISSNKLILNIDKTEYMIFHSNKNIPHNIESLKIGITIIKDNESIKFISIVVDRQLSWSNHIQNIYNKWNKQCGILYLTHNYFDTNAHKQIYYSFICPCLSYCHTVWGAAGKTKLYRMTPARKKDCKNNYMQK